MATFQDRHSKGTELLPALMAILHIALDLANEDVGATVVPQLIAPLK